MPSDRGEYDSDIVGDLARDGLLLVGDAVPFGRLARVDGGNHRDVSLRVSATDRSPAGSARRRVDPARGRLRLASRAGRVSFALAVRGGDWEYCTRRLFHLPHEVFLAFLPDGPYGDYRVEQLGVDPDAVWT